MSRHYTTIVRGGPDPESIGWSIPIQSRAGYTSYRTRSGQSKSTAHVLPHQAVYVSSLIRISKMLDVATKEEERMLLCREQ